MPYTRPIQKTCEWCHKRFIATVPRRIFCSRSCSARHRWETKPGWKEAQRQRMVELRNRPDVQEKIQKHLHSANNPLNNPKVRAKASAKLKEMGYYMLNGGNGQSLPVPQKRLFDCLNWASEYVMPTGKRHEGYPPHYKIDIANPILKIGIEVDGETHHNPRVRAADQRKEEFLHSKGWVILRFKNRQVMTDLENVLSTISKQVQEIILQKAC